MKKLTGFFVLCFVIGSVVVSQAQIGIKAMGNYSIVYGKAEVDANDNKLESADFGIGFAAGIFYRTETESLVGFQGELLYEQRSSSSTKSYASNLIEFTSDNTYSYVNLPLLAVINIGNLKPYAGINVGYLLSAKGVQNGTIGAIQFPKDHEVDFLGKNSDTPLGTDYSDDPYFNKLEVGANIGIMFQITSSLHVDLRIMHEITDFTNDKYDTSIVDGTSREDNDRTLNISLGLGYSF